MRRGIVWGVEEEERAEGSGEEGGVKAARYKAVTWPQFAFLELMRSFPLLMRSSRFLNFSQAFPSLSLNNLPYSFLLQASCLFSCPLSFLTCGTLSVILAPLPTHH